MVDVSQPPDLAELLASTLTVVRRAADLSLSMLEDGVEDWQKKDSSPVTEIDIAVDRLLRHQLRALLPTAGWLSEETVDDHDRLGDEFVWIVDPIDGTRSLLANTAEFAISVALSQRDVGPVLAVVHNPRTDEVFAAIRGKGAWEVGAGTLRCAPYKPADTLHLLVSRTELKKGLWNNLGRTLKSTPTSSLAYKMARVARGDADATLTPWRRSEWDAAAGELLILEAGGRVADVTGTPIVYNRPKPKLKGIIAASNDAWDAALALTPELRRRRSVIVQKYGKDGVPAAE